MHERQPWEEGVCHTLQQCPDSENTVHCIGYRIYDILQLQRIYMGKFKGSETFDTGTTANILLLLQSFVHTAISSS